MARPGLCVWVTIVVGTLAGCVGSGDEHGRRDLDEARIADAQAALGAFNDEAASFAADYDEQLTRMQSEESYDVVAAMAFLDAAPVHLTAMAEHMETLQRLVDEEDAARSERSVDDLLGQASSALTPSADCESQVASGFWDHLRGFLGNVLGGPISTDNLYTAATEGNKIRDTFNDKWKPRLDACERIQSAIERDLCLAVVQQESRGDFAKSASDLAESGGFVVIKSIGAGLVGIGVGAGASALAVPALGAVAIGAVGTVIAEDVIDYLFRPTPPEGQAAAPAVVVARVLTSPNGTQVSLPAGRYEVLAQPRGTPMTVQSVTVGASGTTVVPTECPPQVEPGSGDPPDPPPLSGCFNESSSNTIERPNGENEPYLIIKRQVAQCNVTVTTENGINSPNFHYDGVPSRYRNYIHTTISFDAEESQYAEEVVTDGGATVRRGGSDTFEGAKANIIALYGGALTHSSDTSTCLPDDDEAIVAACVQARAANMYAICESAQYLGCGITPFADDVTDPRYSCMMTGSVGRPSNFYDVTADDAEITSTTNYFNSADCQ